VCRGAVPQSSSTRKLAWAARPAAVSAPLCLWARGSRKRSSGPSVRWRPAHRLVHAEQGSPGIVVALQQFPQNRAPGHRLTYSVATPARTRRSSSRSSSRVRTRGAEARHTRGRRQCNSPGGRHRNLTAPSSGQTKASLGLPLMSNVSPLPGIPMRRVTTVRTTSRAASRCERCWSVPVARGGAVLDRKAAETQVAPSARAVRPLAAGAPSVLLARGRGVVPTAVLASLSRRALSQGKHTHLHQARLLKCRASTLVQRVRAQPQCLAGVSTLGWQSHACGAREVVPSFARANTSVERTAQRPLRVLWSAAHLRR
jgi:hypothetical protein